MHSKELSLLLSDTRTISISGKKNKQMRGIVWLDWLHPNSTTYSFGRTTPSNL